MSGIQNTAAPRLIASYQAAADRSKKVSDSIVSGKKGATGSVVANSLARVIRDNAIKLDALGSNIVYGDKMLSTVDTSINLIADKIEEGLTAVAASGNLSSASLNILQNQIDDSIKQINLFINSANFDGKKVLAGQGKMDVQVGLDINDKIQINVQNLSGNRVFRSDFTNAMNNYLETRAKANTDMTAMTTYFGGLNNGKNEVLNGVNAGKNLANDMLNNVAGTGTGGALLNPALGNLLVALRGANTAAFDSLTATLPELNAALVAGGTDMANANGAAFDAALSANGNRARTELNNAVSDNGFDLNTPAGRAQAQDVFTSSLKNIRTIQASLETQNSNLESMSQSIAETVRTNNEVADSFDKTDYLKAAEEAAETFRALTVSIAMMRPGKLVAEELVRMIQGIAG